ncbi:aldehyde dehydrogenase [Euzebya tangerina]|uniref:aldehyde dehydrogenase n=1 Tax=Euzebya tangerina TaxID=591198 RepID=UPI000E3104F3|nr:aldehyde dehydrogenase [Euzebya tangerina]
MDTIQLHIDGQSRPAEDGGTFETVNPHSQAVWATVAHATRSDVDDAIAAARRAFDDGPWPRMSPGERQEILHAVADAVTGHLEELAQLDSRDMGKPIAAARAKDIPRVADNLRFFADYAAMATDERLPMTTGHHAYTTHDPAGVTVAISPWNFPLMLASWKIAPALAFGNTVVLKPAEQTPASAARFAEIAEEAGLPPGVLNVVLGFGPDDVGEWLTSDRRVDRITFTGESNTGRAIGQAAMRNLTPVSFELGGKGANLVFEDCDLEAAVEWSIKAIYTNAGQVCLAGSRLYVQRAVYEEFVARFVEAAEAMVVGDPSDEATQIGPLASEEHFGKVSSYLDLVPEEGGKILTGGVGAGWTVRPTVITDIDPAGRVACEEIFGPVVVIQPFDTEEEGIALANDTPYGLNAMLFTENLRRAHRVAGLLRAGSVWINCFFVRDLRAPFGGYGDSGIGREGGAYSREFFTEPKAVIIEP